MLKDLFNKKNRYGTVTKISKSSILDEKPNIPSGLWLKCDKCASIQYKEDLIHNSYVCTNCNNHFRIKAITRIKFFFDEDSFKEIGADITTKNPLSFEGYEEKVEESKKKTPSSEAVTTGIGKVNGITVAAGVMDSYFMMGSMGTAVGERLARIIEYATAERLPLIIFATSGGARMQEGIFSLMQMAKVSAAIAKHDDARLLYITVLTNPTTGGVTASFAMEGDIIISEPNALIGFAGRRVIEETIKEKLPDDFQKAEFLQDKGFVDAIVDRRELRKYIYRILSVHEVKNYE